MGSFPIDRFLGPTRGHVLLVVADADEATVLSLTLEMAGFRVRYASDATGVALGPNQSLDAVVAEVNLPGAAGLAITPGAALRFGGDLSIGRITHNARTVGARRDSPAAAGLILRPVDLRLLVEVVGRACVRVTESSEGIRP